MSDKESILECTAKFLQSVDIKKIIIFPDAYGWQLNTNDKKSGVIFDNVPEAVSFLDREMQGVLIIIILLMSQSAGF